MLTSDHLTEADLHFLRALPAQILYDPSKPATSKFRRMLRRLAERRLVRFVPRDLDGGADPTGRVLADAILTAAGGALLRGDADAA